MHPWLFAHSFRSQHLRSTVVAWVVMVLGLIQPVLGQETYLLEGGQWEKQTAHDPATPEGQLQQTRVALAQDHLDRALELAGQWIEQHPNHPMQPEAYLLRGDIKVAQKEYYQALFDYEHMIRYFPASPVFSLALEREYQVARLFASGVKRRFVGMRILSAAGEAEEIFIRIQERSPGSRIGELASIALGDFYFDRSQMSSAAEAYDLYLTNYPHGEHTERAMLQLIRANLATFKGPRFDPTGLIDAAHRLETFRRQFPAAAEKIGAEALLVRIDESLALKNFYTAQWYEKREQKVSATYLYRRVIRDYPQTAAAQSSIKRLVHLGEPITANGPGDRTPGVVGTDKPEQTESMP